MAGYTGREMFKHIQDLTTEVAQLKRELAREKAAHKSVVLELKNIVQCQAERIVLLENENDRLRKIINGDSGNTSKPPSSDIKPNIPNNREKSGRKPGGQKGRAPKYLCKKDVEAKIASGEYAHEIMEVGERSAEYKSKYTRGRHKVVFMARYFCRQTRQTTPLYSRMARRITTV